MRRPSLLKNSSTGARNVGSRTWQEHHITQLPTEQQNAWCRLSSKHWESLLYPWNVLFRNSWCSIGERRHPVVSLRVNCWIPGSYGQGSIRCCHRLHTLHKAGDPRRLQSHQMTPDSGGVAKVTRQYKAGDPVYALYHGPRRDKHPRWVPAIVKKSLGTRCFNVKVVPHGPVWRRHWEQLQPRYVTNEDNEPGDVVDNVSELSTDHPMEIPGTVPQPVPGPRLYHLAQSTDRTIPDDREGYVNPTKDIVVDA